jgi:predicted membrane-bound spermidine synthase
MHKTWLGAASVFSLAAGLAAPVLYFLGAFSEARFKLVLLIASGGWFVFAALWSGARKRSG